MTSSSGGPANHVRRSPSRSVRPPLTPDAWRLLSEGRKRFSPSEDFAVVQTADGADALMLDVPAVDIRTAWDWFREQRARTGMWPIAVASARDIVEGGGSDPRYRGQDVESVLLDRNGAFDHRAWWLPVDEDQEPFEPTDDRFWIDVRPEHQFHYEPPYIFTDGPGYLALLPVVHGWQVIEAIRWSDGNSLPWWVHAGALRRWEQRWGAELACIDLASIDLFIPHPPGVGPATFDLALEISGYGDTFNGHLDTVNRIASSVAVSTTWNFWFD